MNPQADNDQTASNLPKPQLVVNNGSASLVDRDAEAAKLSLPSSMPGTANNMATPGQQTVPPPSPLAPKQAQTPIIPPPLAPSAGPPTKQITVVDSPASAEDNDLIEQEWVSKAKAIVDHTRNDPYLQNKQINEFKADYIKKRYNKEIKKPEGNP